jgi:ABC-type sugar transport system ATPase subunit
MSRFGRVSLGRDRELAARFVRELSIAPPDPERRIDLLSGGNQQKAVISRWLSTGPKVLILDEPTRGVDVGAKAEIHRIVGELVAGGLAVVMISSELAEVLGVCDRVVVMRDGRACAPLERAELSEERIMALATGEEAA